MSQDKKDHWISVYDNVPAPTNICKKVLNQFNNFDGDEDEDIRRRIQKTIDKKMLDGSNNYDEDEDIRRRSHVLRRNKLTHHFKRCFCKIENAFLRFD